jgi:hypothetical protein
MSSTRCGSSPGQGSTVFFRAPGLPALFGVVRPFFWGLLPRRPAALSGSPGLPALFGVVRPPFRGFLSPRSAFPLAERRAMRLAKVLFQVAAGSTYRADNGFTVFGQRSERSD